MERLEQVKNWLMGFPLWGEAEPAVDVTGANPGDCALFPLGVEVLQTRQDVLGNQTRRLRQSFLLRRAAMRGEDAAVWLLSFQDWALRNAQNAPVFGGNQQFRCERGRLIAPGQTGSGTYEVRLTAEYDDEENDNV